MIFGILTWISYLVSPESFWVSGVLIALFRSEPQVAQLAMLHKIVNSFGVNPDCSKYSFPTYDAYLHLWWQQNAMIIPVTLHLGSFCIAWTKQFRVKSMK